MDETTKSTSDNGLQKLINLILKRFVLSRKEAYEVLLKVKERNRGVLKGMKIKKFFRLVGKINFETNYEKQLKRKQLQKETKGTCSFCYKVFCDNQARDRHIEKVHSVSFEFLIDEEVEVEAVERKIKEDDEEGIINSVKSVINEVLDNVLKRSREKSIVRCPECEQTFSLIVNMKRHLKQHAKDETKHFQCDMCDVKTNRKDNLDKHKRKVHKTFKTNFELLRNRGKDSNYTCKMCGEKFDNDPYLLETHIVRKACQKPTDPIGVDGKYHCDLCPRSYTIKWDLSRHIEWKHKLSQVFSCDVCKKQFYNQYSLERHKKKLHVS